MNEISTIAYDNLLVTVKENLDEVGDFGLFAQSYSQANDDVHFTDFGQDNSDIRLVPLYEEPGNGPVWNLQRHQYWPNAIAEIQKLHTTVHFLFCSMASPARIMLTESKDILQKGVYALVDSGSEAYELVILLEEDENGGIGFSEPVLKQPVASILSDADTNV